MASRVSAFLRLLKHQHRILQPKISIYKDKPQYIFGFATKWTKAKRTLLGVTTTGALSFFSKKTESEAQPSPEEKQKSEVEIILSTADKLYADNQSLELYDYLVQYKDSDNDEVLWRLARAATDKGKLSNNEQKKLLFYEAFDYVKKALDINSNNASSNKWYAILLDYTGEFEGIKARIAKSYDVKQHLLKAVELNPSDATSIHSLGVWCFTFADMPWYQKKICEVIFTTPPTSSYQEALEFFLKAEETDPKFYSMNLVMIGKSYLRLGYKDKAKDYLRQAYDYPAIKPDDHKAHKESTDLLKSLGEQV